MHTTSCNITHTNSLTLTQALTVLQVGAGVNLVRQLTDVDLKAGLDRVENLRILLRGGEGDGKPLCPKPPRTRNLRAVG